MGQAGEGPAQGETPFGSRATRQRATQKYCVCRERTAITENLTYQIKQPEVFEDVGKSDERNYGVQNNCRCFVPKHPPTLFPSRLTPPSHPGHVPHPVCELLRGSFGLSSVVFAKFWPVQSSSPTVGTQHKNSLERPLGPILATKKWR